MHTVQIIRSARGVELAFIFAAFLVLQSPLRPISDPCCFLAMAFPGQNKTGINRFGHLVIRYPGCYHYNKHRYIPGVAVIHERHSRLWKRRSANPLSPIVLTLAESQNNANSTPALPYFSSPSSQSSTVD